jgi:hypothetical protein
MATFKSSILWGLFEYTEFFIAPQKNKSGAQRLFDHPVFNSFAIFLFGFQSAQMYPDVFLIYFIFVAVILLASLALMVQFPYCYILTVEVNVFSNEYVSGVVSITLFGNSLPRIYKLHVYYALWDRK